MAQIDFDFEERYREARENVFRLQSCLEILNDIISQQKEMQMGPHCNLLSILAEIQEADIESTDVLLKPLAKACRKALNRNKNAMKNYEILAQ